jgi:hypothetical protein
VEDAFTKRCRAQLFFFNYYFMFDKKYTKCIRLVKELFSNTPCVFEPGWFFANGRKNSKIPLLAAECAFGLALI